jgi:hypothetical protein
MFFALLSEMYRVDAEEKLKLIGIQLIPHMKKQEADSLIDSYKQATNDMISLTQPVDDYSGIQRLKRKL